MMKTKKYNLVITLLLAAVTGLLFFSSSCTKEELIKPTIDNIDPGEASVNTTLTVTGSGLRDIKSIVFDLGNVPVTSFNPNFNTDNAIIFRVPSNANSGDQNIVFTNTSGFQFTLPFRVLPLAVVSSAFPREWEAGNIITLSGSYFESVDDVVLEATSQAVTIVSKTSTTLVLQMPASTAPSSKLIIHNNAGSSTTDISFLNLDRQVKLFTEDFGQSIENWSWCEASKSAAGPATSGSSSLKTVYDNFEGLSFRRAAPFVGSEFKALSFWIKGGSRDLAVAIRADAVVSGSAPGANITVPANVWTYFNIPMSGTFDAVTFERLNFQASGIPAGQETLYLDNVVLVKEL
jgi:hypothetical protein